MNGSVFKVYTGVLSFFFTLGVFAQEGTLPINEVTKEELGKGILVDVRTPGEFSAGHLEGARNIDWLGDDFTGEISKLPKDKTIYLYCQKGGRSSRAAEHLNSLGYSVIDLSGGYQAFSKN